MDFIFSKFLAKDHLEKSVLSSDPDRSNTPRFQVLLSEHKTTGEIFAVKVLNKDTIIQNDDVECTMTERRILALSTRHPFLTGLYCSFQTKVCPTTLPLPDLLLLSRNVSFSSWNTSMAVIWCFKFNVRENSTNHGHVSMLRKWLSHWCSYIGTVWSIGRMTQRSAHEHFFLIRSDLKLDNILLDAEGHCKIAEWVPLLLPFVWMTCLVYFLFGTDLV